MTKRLSEMYGLGIYTQKAEHVGEVEDIILNLEKGEIMRISTKSFKAKTLPSEEVRKILQSDTIPYSDVSEVGDIILIEKAPKKTGIRKSKD